MTMAPDRRCGAVRAIHGAIALIALSVAAAGALRAQSCVRDGLRDVRIPISSGCLLIQCDVCAEYI